MSLLNSPKKIFITETTWVALLDTNNPNNARIKTAFKNMLDQQNRLITSSYVIDAVLEILKQKGLQDQATQFLDIIERAQLGNYLKVFWLNRRLRREAIELFLREDFEKMTRALNIILIRQKKVDIILTLNPTIYSKHELSCFSFE
jgi:predicted nucleic acid-binding protein